MQRHMQASVALDAAMKARDKERLEGVCRAAVAWMGSQGLGAPTTDERFEVCLTSSHLDLVVLAGFNFNCHRSSHAASLQ